MSDREKFLNVLMLNVSYAESSFAELDMNSPRFSNVSFFRGSERKSKCREDSSKRRLSFKSVDSSDEYYDSDSGKQMILRDQELMEQEVTFTNSDADCTGCSSWVPVTSKKLPWPVALDTDAEKSQVNVSVGEYIMKRSENIGQLESPVHKKEFFGCDASTPAGIERELSIIDKTVTDLADFSKWTISNHYDHRSIYGSFPMSPKFIYSVSSKKGKTENPDPLHYFIGMTCYKNLQKLKDEERNSKKNSCIGNDRRSPEQWTVHPEHIVLDVRKGTRVQLINNSNRDKKFKAIFDSHIIMACPLDGTVRAKNQIGLRLTVLRSLKNLTEDIETIVKIISGSSEKIIHVKINKQNKKISVKERSFILY